MKYQSGLAELQFLNGSLHKNWPQVFQPLRAMDLVGLGLCIFIIYYLFFSKFQLPMTILILLF